MPDPTSRQTSVPPRPGSAPPSRPGSAPPSRPGTLRIPLDGDTWHCKAYLGEEWRMRRAYAADTNDVDGWIPATVPGSVLADAVRAGEAPDPRLDRNSRDCEWAAQRSWVYRRRVPFDEDLAGRRAIVHLEGIDYAAEVFLDGAHVGTHEGMFAPAELDVTDILARAGEDSGEHLLSVVLAPAPDSEPQVGRTERVHAAKSRMTYGWDFCPRVIHQGIWDHVWLDIVAGIRITDLHARTVLARDGHRADVVWDAAIEADRAGVVTTEMALVHPDGRADTAVERLVVAAGATTLHGSHRLDEPALWWPNGVGDRSLGDQPLYALQLRARLHEEGGAAAAGDDGHVVGEDERSIRFGCRSVELLPNAGAPAGARPYTVAVNGVRVYVQGWNWVPMDIDHGVEDPTRLDHLIELAARAGVNLLRVWGGGLIEREAFYDLCDRHGIMVWQEFPLSSSGISSRPSDDPAYVTLMAGQAERIVPRRRNHPSLILWCGGNELDNAHGAPLDDDEPVIAAMRRVVARLDPDRPWLPTSPTGPHANLTLAALEEDPGGQHDVHGPWEHQGLEGQRTLYNRATSLLHSEFGVEGMSNLATIEAFWSPGRRWPADRSNPYWVHRGDWWINTPLVQDSFGHRIEDLATLVRASQLLQAEGLRYAVESNRRRQWRNSGSIPWQFNESFPNGFCTSAVDYCGRPKAAYYAVARAYRPLQASARFPTLAWHGRATFEAELWLSNGGAEPRTVRLEAALVTPDGTRHHEQVQECSAPAAGSRAAARVSWPLEPLTAEVFWLDLRVTDGDADVGSVSTRYLFTRTRDLEPLLLMPPTNLRVEHHTSGDDAAVLTVSNDGPTAALLVAVADGRPARVPGFARFSDSHFSLLPGEERHVDVTWSGMASADAPSARGRIVVAAWNSPEVTVG